jgi:hypothetical protein
MEGGRRVGQGAARRRREQATDGSGDREGAARRWWEEARAEHRLDLVVRHRRSGKSGGRRLRRRWGRDGGPAAVKWREPRWRERIGGGVAGVGWVGDKCMTCGSYCG